MKVALTGGIGAGKSTVAAMLRDCGAYVVDADALAREVLTPGRPEFDQVLRRFGPDVVGADGSLERAALGRVVFADPQARRDLEAIVHPAVLERSAQLMAAAPAGAVVIYDVPLLAETGRADEFDAVVVVEAAEEMRIARLRERQLPESEARARMAAQTPEKQRRALAHHVLNNSGTRGHLERQVQELWSLLQERAAAR